MSKVLFLQNIRYDYLGVMMLSAVLKRAGHDCHVAIGDSFNDFQPLFGKEQPDIIGFSLMSGLHLWANEISAQIRKALPGTKPFIIYGGPHPTFFPDILEKSAADAVCIGEGEGAIVDLADCLTCGEQPSQIANLHIKNRGNIVRNPVRPLIDNLDTLPFPDRELYYSRKYFRMSPTKPFMTGRGCPYNCTFCYNKTIRDLYRGKGTFVRLRSPANVIAEIKWVKQTWGMRTVKFFDDTFGLNKEWTLQLLQLYREQVQLPFFCRVRANTVDEELIAVFKDAGCSSVFFAVETANERLREEILRKHITNADIERTAALLRKYRINFFTYNMIGIPEETVDDIYATIQFNVKIGTSYPWCSIFNPYPGTDLADYCIRKGYIDGNFDPDQLATTYHQKPVIQHANFDEISNIHKFFQFAVLVPALIPVLRRAAKLRPNAVFTIIFAVVYFINYVRSERAGFLHSLILAWHHMKLLLGITNK